MTRMLAMLMLGLLATLPSCATNDGSATDASASKQAASPLVVLTNRDGNIRLTHPVNEAGPLQLHAFGELLMGAVGSRPASRPELWIDGKALAGRMAGSFQMEPPMAGSEWQYGVLNLPATNVAGLKSSQRRFLCIEPDLVVVLDEVSLTESALLETGHWFSSGLGHDSVRDEWTVQTPRAGMTARILSSPKSKQTKRDATDGGVGGVITNSAAACVRSTVSEKAREYYQITVLVVHAAQSRRSLAFKLLESDTAIGVRVHRDGLPTLVAFRKAGCVGEANLTGMKFDAPVAVDVFRPKKK
jgi:hypothetical protein